MAALIRPLRGETSDVEIIGLDSDRFVLRCPSPLTEGEHLRLDIPGGMLQDSPHASLDVEISSNHHDRAHSASGWIVSACAQGEQGKHFVAKMLTHLRKSQHIELCATGAVEGAQANPAFAEVGLLPCALPECDWQDLDTSVTFLGQRFSAPIMITGMTGGVARGTEINLRLARAAASHGIPMGVGSQRIAIEHPEFADIFAVKKQVPEVFLIANIGAGQLAQLGRDGCLRAVDMIDADALAIHVNVLQEIVQVEGDRRFSGIFAAIESIVRQFPVPVMVKEVGAGLDPLTARRLVELGVAALDTGGSGGTSWSGIEGMRAGSPSGQRLGEMFRDWGLPTAHCIRLLRNALPQTDISATGGIRDGHMIAKAVGLGATMAGIGLPLFRSALLAEDAPKDLLDTFLRELKTAMICSGSRTIRELRARTFTSEAFDRTTAMLANAYAQIPRANTAKTETAES